MFEEILRHFMVVQTLDINLVPVARPARRRDENSYDLGVQVAGKDAIMTLVDITITYHKFNSESKWHVSSKLIWEEWSSG